jgi:hypothetical protein
MYYFLNGYAKIVIYFNITKFLSKKSDSFLTITFLFISNRCHSAIAPKDKNDISLTNSFIIKKLSYSIRNIQIISTSIFF